MLNLYNQLSSSDPFRLFISQNALVNIPAFADDFVWFLGCEKQVIADRAPG